MEDFLRTWVLRLESFVDQMPIRAEDAPPGFATYNYTFRTLHIQQHIILRLQDVQSTTVVNNAVLSRIEVGLCVGTPFRKRYTAIAMRDPKV